MKIIIYIFIYHINIILIYIIYIHFFLVSCECSYRTFKILNWKIGINISCYYKIDRWRYTSQRRCWMGKEYNYKYEKIFNGKLLLNIWMVCHLIVNISGDAWVHSILTYTFIKLYFYFHFLFIREIHLFKW